RKSAKLSDAAGARRRRLSPAGAQDVPRTRRQKRLLVRRAGATENRIAVGKAAEAPNNIGVQLRPFQSFGIAAAAAERHATLLVGWVFGVLERPVETQSHRVWH